VRWPLLLAIVPIVFAAGLTYAFLQSGWLTVQEVRVAGAESLDVDDVAAISGLEGKSMLRLPLDEARGRLLELPNVRSATFERDWPRAVTVHIEERAAVAFWSVGGRDYPVDADGVVLAAGAPSEAAPRIVEAADRVMGPGDRVQPDAIALAQRISAEAPSVLGEAVSELEYRPGIGVTAIYTNGLRVTFGDERAYEYKVAVLSQLLQQLQAQGVTPTAVDLRFGERVTYE
jgi:cell division protein FtsQ